MHRTRVGRQVSSDVDVFGPATRPAGRPRLSRISASTAPRARYVGLRRLSLHASEKRRKRSLELPCSTARASRSPFRFEASSFASPLAGRLRRPARANRDSRFARISRQSSASPCSRAFGPLALSEASFALLTQPRPAPRLDRRSPRSATRPRSLRSLGLALLAGLRPARSFRGFVRVAHSASPFSMGAPTRLPHSVQEPS